MIRYLNTDNQMVVEVPDWMAPKYDRSCNMQRLDDEVAVKPEPKPAPRKTATRKVKK